MLLGDGVQLPPDQVAATLLIGEDRLERLDALVQLAELLFQLATLQVGQLREAHGQDRPGLLAGDLQGAAQVLGGRFRRAARLDDLHHLIDPVQCDEQTLEYVGPGFRLLQVVGGAANDHLEAVLDPDLQRLLQVQLSRNAVHQGQYDHAEGVLELGLAEELLQ